MIFDASKLLLRKFSQRSGLVLWCTLQRLASAKRVPEAACSAAPITARCTQFVVRGVAGPAVVARPRFDTSRPKRPCRGRARL